MHFTLGRGKVARQWLYGIVVSFDNGVPLGYNHGKNPAPVFEENCKLISRKEEKQNG